MAFWATIKCRPRFKREHFGGTISEGPYFWPIPKWCGIVRQQKYGYESKMEAEDRHMPWSFSENKALTNSMLDHHFPHCKCHLKQTQKNITAHPMDGDNPITATSKMVGSIRVPRRWTSRLHRVVASEGGKSSAKPTSMTTASGGSMEHSLGWDRSGLASGVISHVAGWKIPGF